MNRYNSRRVFKNDLEEYEHLLQERDVSFIRHYSTPVLRYPTVEELRGLRRIRHIWTTGDRFYKLAARYYERPEYWWVIAQFNQKPTEAHLVVGDVIRIPLPLESVLALYDQG